MAEYNHITAGGLEKLQQELDELRSQRPVISAQIAEARDKGDLSENAEYDAAKEAQGLLEMRIAKLEETIAKAKIIDPSKIKTDRIQILSKVKILCNGKKMEYTLVSESEANLKEGKLSISTPIGKALLGRKKGDTMEITVPSGKLNVEVLEISVG